MAFYKRLERHLRDLAEKASHPAVTPWRLVNYYVSFLEARVFQREHVLATPWRVYFETCSACTLRCPLCPTGVGRAGAKRGVMTAETFRAVFRQLRSGLLEAHLYNWGEPFLSKHIFEIIRETARGGVRSFISTNLNVFDEEKARELVASALDVLWISLDGASQQTYEQYRVGGDFEAVLTNIRAVLEARRRARVRYPRVEWRFLVMRHNEHEQERARRLARKIGVDSIVFEPVRVDTYWDVFTPLSERIEEDMRWLPEGDRRYDHAARDHVEDRGWCWHPWRWAAVNCDGTVSPCCSAYDAEFNLGDALGDGFRAVWNAGRYRAARRAVSRGGERCPTGVICSYCHRFRIRHRREAPAWVLARRAAADGTAAEAKEPC